MAFTADDLSKVLGRLQQEKGTGMSGSTYEHIKAMDYESKHGYQRDWDRKALGNFEMAVMEGKQSRLSSAQDVYGDEKGLTAPEGDAPAHEYPSTPRLLLLSFGLAMIVFTMSLDNTVSEELLFGR